MEQLLLLESLRMLVGTAPPLEGLGSYGQKQFVWLGKASALISAWNRSEAITFNVAVSGMTGNFNRVANHGAVFTTIHKAIASIEQELPKPTGQVFGPGAAYDFFVSLRVLVASTERSLFLIDPYMDAETFDGYLSAIAPGKSVRLLLTKYADNVRVASEKFALQNSTVVEVRKSNSIHDRVIIVDGAQCWVLGASIKDAAAKKPTYLAPLPADVTEQKVRIYEEIWSAAAAV